MKTLTAAQRGIYCAYRRIGFTHREALAWARNPTRS